MSRFVNGFSESNARQNSAPILTTGGTTTGVISTSVTPTGNEVATKAQADALGSGSGGPSTNGVRVLTVAATAATGWYSHSSANSCTWTVPTGITRIFAQVWGGGGAGGGPRCRAISMPGAAGGYTHGIFAVQAGDILCICAGKGGCRGCCLRFGETGGISYVCNSTRGIQLRAYPGAGGYCNMENYGRSSNAPGGGAGGTLNICGNMMAADISCACHKYCDGRHRAYMNGVGPAGPMGGFFTTVVGQSQAMCTSGNCGWPAGPGGGGGSAGMSYPASNKGGGGGIGLVMLWH